MSPQTKRLLASADSLLKEGRERRRRIEALLREYAGPVRKAVGR